MQVPAPGQQAGASVPPGAAVPPATAVQTGPLLTLADCIRLALGRGFDLEIERQSLSIAQDNVPIARSTFLPVLSATTGKSVTRTAETDLLAATRNDTVDAGVGVSQRTLPGTTLGVGVQNGRFDSDPAQRR